MANQEIRSNYQSLDTMTEEFEKYLDKSGVTGSLTAVLKMMYDMEEKPIDPLEFMRTHMTEVIPEKVELKRLQEEYIGVMQQIEILQNENEAMANRLNELEPSGNESVGIADMKNEEIDNNAIINALEERLSIHSN